MNDINNAIITCIGHSGFLVALPEYNLIFDYFTDKKGVIAPDIFKNKKTCVFVSHNHKDHYNTDIFKWRRWSETTYILDAGCDAPKGVNIITVAENDELTVYNGTVCVKVYGSTDEGVSFLVTAGGLTIFHAGDLNDWYWEDKSTPEELAAGEDNYIRIIK